MTKEITLSDLQWKSKCNHKDIRLPDAPFHKVILNGEVVTWVGMGWHGSKKATCEDKEQYPTVVDG